MKIWVSKHSSSENATTAVNVHFCAIDNAYFCEGIKKLEDGRTKFVALNGDYVEKQNALFPEKGV